MSRKRPPLTRILKRAWSSILRSRNPFLTLGLLGAGTGLIVISLLLLWVALTPTPDFDSFMNRKISSSTKIFDRTGQTVLYDLNTDVKQQTIPLADISPYIKNASISIEDSNFYHHGGISFTGIARSLLVDLVHHSFDQGGSTITQQVVKNTILSRDKSITRKVHEWVLAYKLEQHYTKDQILELYLNGNPYGGSLYGVEAASRAFFGKSAKDVDLAEAAYLAALPQAPTYYSPYGNNKAALDTRKNVVLARMKQLGYITNDQYTQAKSETIVFNPAQSGSIIAPHFVFYIREYLENKYGPDVASQGLSVITTLDADLQHQAEATVSKFALANATKFNASNAALVAIDPKTGQVLAMVGSRNYFDTQIDGNYNAALASRQPGSSFKPFVYAAALAKGYTPKTIVFDLPTQFSTSCAPSDNTNDTPPCYAPNNYDGKFRGPMTFTTALAQSINVPAVKALYLAGIQNVIDLATKAGITTLQTRSHYGLSFALGAAEVRLLDLTDAYATFSNNGQYNPPTGILKVTDANGQVLEDFKQQPQQVIDPGVAASMNSMLSNNEARYPEYSAQNPLHLDGFDVAAKTGTTNDYRDAWTVGYSPDIVVGTWAGNNNNSAMVKEIAGYIVAPMWHEFMGYALQKYPKDLFSEPPAIPDTAPPALRGVYSGANGMHDILYWVDKNNPMSGGSSMGDGQFPYWEYPIQAGYGATTGGNTTAPSDSSTTPTTHEMNPIVTGLESIATSTTAP